MHVSVIDGQVDHVELQIYEPPRFFEALLRGRDFREPPDITARICGICPVAYQLSAINAIESPVRRRGRPTRSANSAACCTAASGSRATSCTSSCCMRPTSSATPRRWTWPRDDKELVETALRCARPATRCWRRSVAAPSIPINIKVGGFHRAPTKAACRRSCRNWNGRATRRSRRSGWWPSFDFPELSTTTATWPCGPLPRTRRPAPPATRSSVAGCCRPTGWTCRCEAWPEHFAEYQVPHSTALHAQALDGATYLVGPAARFALNADLLAPAAAQVAAEVGLVAPDRNPFRSIIIRTVETVHALEEALSLIAAYEEPETSSVPVEPVAGTGHGVSEAPRGILYHRYALDEQGLITDAVIAPPTSQNQRAVEADLAEFVQAHLELDDDDLQWRCEQAIRNYDPCISCSTHFLDLTVDRR